MINHLRLDNFRCFASLDLDLSPHSTIVGANGSGKTSILQALDLVLSRSLFASRISDNDFSAANNEEFTIVADLESPIDVELPDGYTSQHVPCRSISPHVSRRQRGSPGKALSDPYTITHHYIPDETVAQTESGWEVLRKSGKAFAFNERLLAVSTAQTREGPRAFYFDKNRERQAKTGYNSTFQRIMQELNWRYQKNASQDELEAWSQYAAKVFELTDTAKMDATIQTSIDRAVEFLRPAIKSLTLELLDTESPFEKAFLAAPQHSKLIPFDSLGSGSAILISFFLLVAISTLSKEDVILLVDEPELHLHPQLQVEIAEYLRKSSFQTICSTHSDRMVNIGNWHSVIRVDGSGTCHPNAQILDLGIEYRGTIKKVRDHLDEIAKYHQDKTILFTENNELLFARKVLLVEGPSEKYGLRMIAFKCKYDWRDLTVISCNGKDKIKYYQLICRAYDIPYFTLFDLDGQPEDDPANAAVRDLSPDGGVYAFSNSFETEFGTAGAVHSAGKTLEIIESASTESFPGPVMECLAAIEEFLHDTES